MRHPVSKPPLSRHCALLLLWQLGMLLAAPANAADAFNGRKLYTTYCEACHGSTGQGEMPGTPNFTRGQGLLQPDLALLHIISDGRNAMPAFQGILENEEILDVITHLRTFF